MKANRYRWTLLGLPQVYSCVTTVLLLVCLVCFSCIVDVLDTVGLRDGNIDEDGAMLVLGPNGLLDAFALTRELSGPMEGREWELIGEDFNTQFGIYATFDSSNYAGTIIAIGNGILTQFSVSLNRSDNAPNERQTLTVELPNFSFDFEVDISTQGDSAFQSIGIALEDERLVITVNCSVTDIIPVEFDVGNLPSDSAGVTIFTEPTTVRMLYICLSQLDM